MFDVKLPNLRWLEERGSMDSILNADPTDEQGLILFYGSSSFTRWKPYWKHRPLEEDIRRKDGSRAAVNHGFGTSTSEELLYYYPRLVKPWNPRAMVIYCHGNDFSAGYSANEVMTLQARLLEWARRDFPGIRFYLETGKPSPKRKEHSASMKRITLEYEQLLRDYCANHEDTTLVDHTQLPDLWQEGHMGDYDYPRFELYVEDGVHFNQDGYDVYRDLYLRVLDDIL